MDTTIKVIIGFIIAGIALILFGIRYLIKNEFGYGCLLCAMGLMSIIGIELVAAVP